MNFKVMKKIYKLLFFATLSSNLFCQQDSLIVRDSVYSYVWDTTTNDWVFSGRGIIKYDANGNETEYIFLL